MGAELTESDVPRAEPLTSASEHESFEAAFADLYARAYQHAFKLLGDRAEAEDLAQEACTRACLRWRRLDNPQAWVLHVTTNLAFDRFRRLRTATKLARLPSSPAVVADDRHLDLHRALAKLPKRQREVIALRYLADLSEAQTAAELGCSPGTVKSHAARGLRALRAGFDLADEVETL
jgi:RNA polymerase sigma-70 factor (sigma-E family)